MYVMCSYTLCTFALQGLPSQQTNKQLNYHPIVIETRTSFRVVKGEPSSEVSPVVNRSVFKSELNVPEPITSHSSNDSKIGGVVPNLLITRLSLVLLEAISYVPDVVALPVWEPIGDQIFVSVLTK
jgi:hypothetical protein